MSNTYSILNTFQNILNNPNKEVKTDEIYEDNKNKYYHRHGLYSEQIFGPVKDYECQCGELKGKHNRGKICSNCGVICDTSFLRYKEFGYINLKGFHVLYPEVIDIFIRKLFPSKYRQLFNKMLTGIISIDKWLFFNKTTKKLEIPPVLEQLMEYYSDLINYNISIQELFNIMIIDKKLPLDKYNELKEQYYLDYPVFGIYTLYRLFKTDFFQKYFQEYITNTTYEKFKDIIFIDKILVCPPELRPYIDSDGKIIIHELTKQLQKIVRSTNNKYMAEINHKELMSKDAMVSDLYYADLVATRLQKYVSEYYDLVLNQISSKEGNVRQYIHGKTIDFSGRAVVTPDLSIKPYQVKIPYYMAREILLPYFINYAQQQNISQDLMLKIILLQEKLISFDSETEIEELFDKFIDEINSGKYKFYAIINRAPTLWIYNFLTFQILVKKDKTDYTISMPVLGMQASNMDYDGDSIISKLTISAVIKKDDNETIEIEKTLNIQDLENITLTDLEE